jgi:hypothetical protein
MRHTESASVRDRRISIADFVPSRNELNIWEFMPACFASAGVSP